MKHKPILNLEEWLLALLLLLLLLQSKGVATRRTSLLRNDATSVCWPIPEQAGVTERIDTIIGAVGKEAGKVRVLLIRARLTAQRSLLLE